MSPAGASADASAVAPAPSRPEGPASVRDPIAEIRRLDGTFARGEQRVASYLLEHLADGVHLNQSAIAEAADVSVATVNRFCRTLGWRGFKDFRIAFAQSVAVSLQYLDDRGGETGGTEASSAERLTDQVFSTLGDALALARRQLDFDAVEAAVERLAAARRIAFLGVGGGSANVAREGANRF